MKTLLAPLALLPFLALAACNGQPTSWGTPPEQLEAFTVSGAASGPAQMSMMGALAVTGSGQDFSVTVAGSGTLAIHTPGQSDLSSLNGHTVTVLLPVSQAGDPSAVDVRSLLVTDDQGPAYLADVAADLDTDTLFGAGFATYGTPVASVITDQTGGYMESEYTPIVFKTDSGEVSLLPGQVDAITVKGAVYRVTVISAVDITYHFDQALACGPSSAMVYEMLRVEAPPAPRKLVRPAGMPGLSLVCLGV
jgi:hypothetical protein